MDISDLTRLIDIDAALASDDGLHIESVAGKHQITPRTVTRLLSLIKQTGREIVLRENPETGRNSRHHYAAGTMRLFCVTPPPAPVGRPKGPHRERIEALASSGATTAEIIAETGLPRSTVDPVLSRWRKKQGQAKA